MYTTNSDLKQAKSLVDALKKRVSELEEEARLRQVAPKNSQAIQKQPASHFFSGPITKQYKSAAATCSSITTEILRKHAIERASGLLKHGKFSSSDITCHM